MKLGDTMPDFSCDSTDGKIDSFHQWLGDSWGILFSHPADYTPVCTTELGRVAQLKDEFDKRGVKLAALSCDSAESHSGWIEDIKAYANLKGKFPFPILADEKRELAVKLGMLDEVEKDAAGLPLTARVVFIIGPDKKLKLAILYPATTGRNFDEVLRVLDSLFLTAHKKVATPVDWKAGGDCMVLPTVKPEETASLYPKGVKVLDVPSKKCYLRITPQPE